MQIYIKPFDFYLKPDFFKGFKINLFLGFFETLSLFPLSVKKNG
jgi:hypothetical protein